MRHSWPTLKARPHAAAGTGTTNTRGGRRDATKNHFTNSTITFSGYLAAHTLELYLRMSHAVATRHAVTRAKISNKNLSGGGQRDSNPRHADRIILWSPLRAEPEPSRCVEVTNMHMIGNRHWVRTPSRASHHLHLADRIMSARAGPRRRVRRRG